MFLAWTKLKVLQFLVAWYPANLEESFSAAPEKVASIDVLSGSLGSEADWDLADSTKRSRLR